ncbi:MAG: hypothetical protein IPO14_04535 [Saprospiraceae bacterium]|nr:hypothetical protein [Saprospiraceae bacterium]
MYPIVERDECQMYYANGGMTGSIDVTVSGPRSLTYVWSDGATTEDRSGLAAGTL